MSNVCKMSPKFMAVSLGTQRRNLDLETVDRYAELMKDDVVFEPVEIIYDSKLRKNILWHGFHRYHAAVKAGLNSIMANKVDGTLADAYTANDKTMAIVATKIFIS